MLSEYMVYGLPIIYVYCKVGPRELVAPGTSYESIISENEIELAEYGILTESNSIKSMVATMTWVLEHPERLKEFKEK